MVPFSTHIACPIFFFFSVDIHHIWVSPWTHLIFFLIWHTWFSSSISPTGVFALYVICPPLPPYDPPLYSSFGCAFLAGCTTFLSNNLFSAFLCLWFLSSLTVLSCYSLMVVGGLSASASFLLIVPFNPLLFLDEGFSLIAALPGDLFELLYILIA